MFWIIYHFFLLNIESIHEQKQCLIDALYHIVKEIIKMDLKSMCFRLRKTKHYLLYGLVQSKEWILLLLNLTEWVFFALKIK